MQHGLTCRLVGEWNELTVRSALSMVKQFTGVLRTLLGRLLHSYFQSTSYESGTVLSARGMGVNMISSFMGLTVRRVSGH